MQECQHGHKILGPPRYDFARNVMVSEGYCRFCRAPVAVESPIFDDFRDIVLAPSQPVRLPDGFYLDE